MNQFAAIRGREGITHRPRGEFTLVTVKPTVQFHGTEVGKMSGYGKRKLDNLLRMETPKERLIIRYE